MKWPSWRLPASTMKRRRSLSAATTSAFSARLRDDAEAEDVVQETYVKAFTGSLRRRDGRSVLVDAVSR